MTDCSLEYSIIPQNSYTRKKLNQFTKCPLPIHANLKERFSKDKKKKQWHLTWYGFVLAFALKI